MVLVLVTAAAAAVVMLLLLFKNNRIVNQNDIHFWEVMTFTKMERVQKLRMRKKNGDEDRDRHKDSDRDRDEQSMCTNESDWLSGKTMAENEKSAQKCERESCRKMDLNIYKLIESFIKVDNIVLGMTAINSVIWNLAQTILKAFFPFIVVCASTYS